MGHDDIVPIPFALPGVHPWRSEPLIVNWHRHPRCRVRAQSAGEEAIPQWITWGLLRSKTALAGSDRTCDPSGANGVIQFTARE
jgi:hypothetical protein